MDFFNLRLAIFHHEIQDLGNVRVVAEVSRHTPVYAGLIAVVPVRFIPNELKNAGVARGIVIVAFANRIRFGSFQQLQTESDGIFSGCFRHFIQERLFCPGNKVGSRCAEGTYGYV